MKAMAGVGMAPELATVVTADDGITRCRWATETGRDLTGYHDGEWGVPTHDEALLFEALAMTYFENGLSWAIVFDKREGLRQAFHGFNPGAVAAMTADDVERLMADSAIIRNRRKIEATVTTLACCRNIRCRNWRGTSPHKHHRLKSWADGRMASPESGQLSKALQDIGFRLVGPVVAHSFMQAVGIENGHFDGCFLAPL